MSEATHSAAPAEAASAITNGETPSPLNAETQQDAFTKEEQARATLRGEVTSTQFDPEDINNQFDPETGELLDEDPTTTQADAAENGGSEASTEAETEEERAEREDTETAREKKEPKRIRINRDNMTDRDFAIVRLADDQGITLAEAEQRLFGAQRPKTTERPAAEAQASAIPDLEARIAQLRARRENAADTMDMKAVVALNDELSELREQLTDAKREQRQQQMTARQAEADRYTTTETASITRALELYPDANRGGSALNKALFARKSELQTTDPHFFQNPKWPMLLVVDVAADLGIAATLKGQAKPGAQRPAALVPPKKMTRPAPTPADGAATSATPSANSEAALAAELKTARDSRDVNAIKAVMRKIDSLPRRR